MCGDELEYIERERDEMGGYMKMACMQFIARRKPIWCKV